MDFTQEHMTIAFNAWAAFQDGGGVVIEDPGLYPPADELAEAGWLERRFVGDDLAWFWTARGETALDLNALLQSADGRHN